MTLVRPDGPVPISGSGTSNTVAMFTGSLTLGDSVITQNSSQIGISTGAISARLHITGSGTTNATFTIKANNASVNTFYIRDDAEAGFSDDGINYFTIRQLASATYFKTSGASGYVFNNASDATNIGKISNTGQILFGDITDTNYAGAGIAIKATGLTSNVAKEIFAVFYKNNTDNDGIFLASKQNNCYVQPYSPSNVNQTLILGGRNSASGPFETLTLNSSGRATITNTSEQLRIAYDSSNYATWTTSSTGSVTISAAGGSGVGVFDFNTIINGGGTTVRSINTSTGTAAYSAFGLENSANSAVLFKLSTLYTTNGLFTANSLVIQNAGNIAFNASTGNSVLLGVNNTEIARVNATGLGVGVTPTSTLHIVGSTPTSGLGTNFQVTGNNNNPSLAEAMRIQLIAGYTGSAFSAGAEIYNASAGTGADLNLITSFSNPGGNVGLNAFAHATTTGYNIGGYYEALGGNINVGLIGKSVTTKNSATNIGVIGNAQNGGTTPIIIGGYFALNGADNPTFNSGALICDNGSTTSNIFAAYDNAVLKWSIADGGALTAAARLLGAQGADVASATNLTLGSDGNAFEITGITTIDLISITGWQNGSVVRLVFNESLTVRHGIATSGSNVTILLAGAANFSATANDTLTLMLCETTAGGQAWREVARSVN